MTFPMRGNDRCSVHGIAGQRDARAGKIFSAKDDTVIALLYHTIRKTILVLSITLLSYWDRDEL